VIADDQSLSGAKTRFGSPIRIWDAGFGPLWIYREPLGVLGIVRASTWEEAYECVIDEIMHDADPTDFDDWPTDGEQDLPEGVHYRYNGVPSNDGLESAMAAEDLNGAFLDPLTQALLDELQLTLEISDD